ncbi:MAG: lysylphosphatidylglycerol synthase transmembrane domain-containing protein [Acidimicrobiales bacterium]
MATLAIRLGLSAVMLAVLVWRLPDVKWSDLGPRWNSTSPLWLVGAAATMLLAFALSALRWQRVLSAIRPTPPFRRMFSHFLAGQFVSNVLPTAFGGDVVRVARLGRDLSDTPTAFASVTIERLTGWLVLPLISLTALLAQSRLRGLGSATSLALSIAAGTLVALIGLLLVASNRRFATSVDQATGWRRFLVAIHVGVDALRRDPAASAEVVAVGAAFQLLQCVAVWMAAEAIGVTAVTLGVSLAFFPAAAIAQNLPVGLGGLGVREGVFVVFFGAVGAPRALSITLGLVVYGLTIVTSAFGAPSFVLGGRHAHAAPPAPSQNPHTSDVTRPPHES